MRKITVAIALSAILLSACTDFKDIQVSELNDTQRVEGSSKMTEEENNLLKGYLRRHADTTVKVGQAVKLQKNWEIEKAKEEAKIEEDARIAKEKYEKDLAESNRIAMELKESINNFIKITPNLKQEQLLDVGRKQVPFTVFFIDVLNQSNKDISGYKAVISILDSQGNILDKALVEKNNYLPTSQVVKDNIALESSRFSMNENFIRQAPLENLLINLDFKLIQFADGSKLEILE